MDFLILGIPLSILQTVLAVVVQSNALAYLVMFAGLAIVVYLDGVKGGTPGKLILGLRIVNEKGEFIGIPMAILRYVGKILSGLIIGIGFLMIIWDKKKQGLHDKIASTYVVKA